MLIYRLELVNTELAFWRGSKKGTGVYHSGAINLNENWLHPIPEDDSLFMENLITKKKGSYLDYVFGFVSPNQMFSWFYSLDHYATVESRGIKVCVYDCPELNVIVGNAQAAFHKWHHTLFNPIEIYNPVDFYKKFNNIKS